MSDQTLSIYSQRDMTASEDISITDDTTYDELMLIYMPNINDHTIACEHVI